MTTTTPSAALVPVTPVFMNTERLALAGFLAGYSGLTHQAYELDLRQSASWCHQHQVRLFAARRADIECLTRDLEARGPQLACRATGARSWRASWCQQHQVRLFAARRADIECFARDLEARGRARATITRRLCTIAGLYRYAVEEELLDHSPAAHVRRPRLDYESHAVGLDRNELGALLVAAGLGPRSSTR